MKKMIDELWDGEISPQDTLISDNQEYRELQSTPMLKSICAMPMKISATMWERSRSVPVN